MLLPFVLCLVDKGYANVALVVAVSMGRIFSNDPTSVVWYRVRECFDADVRRHATM